MLVLSLSISKYIHKRNLIRVQNLNIQKKSNNEYIEQINTYSDHLRKDSKLSLILAISFAFLTLMQPILLAIDINSKDIYAGNVVNSINSRYLEQKNKIDELILKEKNQLIRFTTMIIKPDKDTFMTQIDNMDLIQRSDKVYQAIK